MSAYSENTAELSRTKSRASTVALALSHMHQDAARLTLGHNGAEVGRLFSREVTERSRRSSMAVYAYSRGPRRVSPQHTELTGETESNVPLHAWAGSGFCVDLEKEGDRTYAIVQTNHHVVFGTGDEFEYSVELYDGPGKKGTRKPAEVLYRDAVRDLAYIRVDITGIDDLKPLKLADPKSIHVADIVASVGNSLNAENNFVPGFVTSEPTVVDEDDYGHGADPEYKGMWKLSPIVSPGNSGGPTVNTDGEVIGMNTASFDGHHGAPVGHALSVEDFQVSAKHVRLFANVQRRLEPIVTESFGGGDDAAWTEFFNRGVQAYSEEFSALYGTNSDPKSIHEKVLNDPGMLMMLIRPLTGSLVRGFPEDIVRLVKCLKSLESQFGITLKVARNLEQAVALNEPVDSAKIIGVKARNDEVVVDRNRHQRAIK